MTDKALVLLGTAHVHLPDHLGSARRAGWRVAAVHDRDADRARSLARDLDAVVLDDPRDCHAHGAAAFVCSETVHHHDDVAAALTAGLQVFCEKPLTVRADDADALAELADHAGLILETGFFLRTYPALQQLRALLQGGVLGDPVHVRANFSHDGGFADWLDLTGWMTDPGLAHFGGFGDEGVHVLDWLMWTFGDVAEGHAVLGHSLGFRLDDHGAAVLRLESGGIAVIEAGWTDTRMRLELAIIGTEGSATLKDSHLRVQRRDGTQVLAVTMEKLDAGRGSAAFLDRCARPEQGPLVPPQEAARATRLLERLYGTQMPKFEARMQSGH
jgi:predicted dehydrogenase